jgi:hypothetical protein
VPRLLRLAPGSGARWAVALLGLLTLATAAAVRLTDASGLTGRVFPAGAEVGPPLVTEHQRAPSTRSILDLESRAGQAPVGLRWDGVLNTTVSREHQIGILASGRVRLRLDNRVVIDHPPGRWDDSELIELDAGPHLLTLEYERGEYAPELELRWDVDSPYRLVPVPASTLSTHVQSPAARAVVRVTPALTVGLAAGWSALLVATLWRMVWRALPTADNAAISTSTSRAVLIGSTLLFAAGIWWGWPGGSWAPDELDPGTVLGALGQRFANGWHDRYPPLHFYLLSAVYAPLLAFAKVGWIDIEGATAGNALYLFGRALSVGMGVGIVVLVGVIGARLAGTRRAWVAAALAAVFLPLPFYAKTANLDVPYLFWFVVSLIFLLSAHDTRRTRDVVGYAVSGALAIATKDQAYGLYVLPALHLAWTLGRDASGRRALVAGLVAGLATLAVTFNVLFNWQGFKSHVELIVGPASQDYRMFPASAAGQAALAWATLREFVFCLGVAGVVLVGVGAWRAVTRRHLAPPPVRRGALAMGLVVASYYLTFLAPIGYVYDRFLISWCLLAAPLAALGLDALIAASGRYARVVRALGWVLVATLVWRAASVDLLLIDDGRYDAERFLRAQMSRDLVVGSVNQFGYLPRLGEFRHREIAPTKEETLEARPNFLVVNTEFPQRFGESSALRQWLQWLESGEAPYVEVYRHKARPRFSALRWQSRFRDRVENDFTNLDKANPEIVVFRRID